MDLEALAAAPNRRATGWTAEALAAEILEADQPPVAAAVRAVTDGAGVQGLLDAVTLAVSHRLLRHDLALELDTGDGFGWLDITHGLTTARASRWAWAGRPRPPYRPPGPVRPVAGLRHRPGRTSAGRDRIPPARAGRGRTGCRRG